MASYFCCPNFTEEEKLWETKQTSQVPCLREEESRVFLGWLTQIEIRGM